MRGFNLLALLLIGLAVVLIWLGISGNYHATAQALTRKYQGGSMLGGSAAR